ncbi:MAG: hypothetical protein MJD61_06620 [Proteobacteria bacterium]|nr:hypothetical protein [Pseudomonadota bacterium]
MSPPAQIVSVRMLVLVPCASIVLSIGAPALRAELPGLRGWAEAVMGGTGAEGARVPYPSSPTRPHGLGLRLPSQRLPLTVHAPETNRSLARATKLLAALEAGYDLLFAESWPLPLPDGGAGDSLGFDLYLRRAVPGRAGAGLDGPVPWGSLDSASSFGLVDDELDPSWFQACALSALAQAALWGQDPGESAAWRRATSSYLAWRATGNFGCGSETSVRLGQAWRSWLGGGGGAGGLLLAMLSAREDGGDGSFVRELWQFARQRSAGRSGVRVRPDLWDALDRALSNAGEALEQVLSDFAVARFFSGTPARSLAAPMPCLRSLATEAAVALERSLQQSHLPTHVSARGPVEVLGSRYTLVALDASEPASELRVWLRGELGVRWLLTAVRLDSGYGELGRVSAPPRGTGRSYVPVVLTPDTARVLVVVTNLGRGLESFRRPTVLTRAFRLVLSLGTGVLDQR